MTQPDIIKFVSDGFERAKKGEALIVYSEVSKIQDSGLLEEKSHYPFGWIIYYALHQGRSRSVIYRKKMLMRYLKLSLRKPHKLHSMILTEAIRLYKDSSDTIYIMKRKGESDNAIAQETFSLIKFLELWNLKNLRDGDWRRKEIDGKPISSTVEKLITQYTAELSATSTQPSKEYLEIMKKAEIDYKDSPAFMAQRAELHILMNEKEMAVHNLKMAILGAPSKFYFWHRLANLIEAEENLRLKMAILFKAVQAPGQEEFKGKIRLDLADGWIRAKAYPQALFELNCIKEVYERNGWHLSPRYLKLRSLIPENTEASNPLTAYRKISKSADDFIFNSLPELETKKTYHKEPTETTDKFGNKRKQATAWRVTDSNGTSYWFTPENFGIYPSYPSGGTVFIKIHEGKVVKARIG